MQEDDLKIDVGDTDEQTTEIDLDAPAPEQSLEEEIHVEKVEQNASEESDAVSYTHLTLPTIYSV